MNKSTIEDLTGVSDDALLAELERRRLTGEDLLRVCKLGTIAAELVWRSSRPVDDDGRPRPWRPGFLTHAEALVLAHHAAHWALQEAAERGEMVACDHHGIAYLTGAALVVLERIEPGRWRVQVVASGRQPDVSVTERDQ